MMPSPMKAHLAIRSLQKEELARLPSRKGRGFERGAKLSRIFPGRQRPLPAAPHPLRSAPWLRIHHRTLPVPGDDEAPPRRAAGWPPVALFRCPALRRSKPSRSHGPACSRIPPAVSRSERFARRALAAASSTARRRRGACRACDSRPGRCRGLSGVAAGRAGSAIHALFAPASTRRRARPCKEFAARLEADAIFGGFCDGRPLRPRRPGDPAGAQQAPQGMCCSASMSALTAVAPAWARRWSARVIEHARARVDQLHAAVVDTADPARALYRKLGFQALWPGAPRAEGRRPGFRSGAAGFAPGWRRACREAIAMTARAAGRWPVRSRRLLLAVGGGQGERGRRRLGRCAIAARGIHPPPEIANRAIWRPMPIRASASRGRASRVTFAMLRGAMLRCPCHERPRRLATRARLVRWRRLAVAGRALRARRRFLVLCVPSPATGSGRLIRRSMRAAGRARRHRRRTAPRPRRRRAPVRPIRCT